MFEPSTKPRVFGVPIGVDFTSDLLNGLDHRLEHSSQSWRANTKVFVNTERMKRRLVDLLCLGPASLHPKVKLITEISDGYFDGQQTSSLTSLKLRMSLFPLVKKLSESNPGLAPNSIVFDLTDSLASLFEEMADEGVNEKDISEIDVTEYGEQWRVTKNFIEIVSRFKNDGSEIKEHVLRTVALELISDWDLSPPKTPFIIAGSTGSRGTTSALMNAVAKLPEGAVVLPGFDFDLPHQLWSDLANGSFSEDHPQYRFASLLSDLELSPSDVLPWHSNAPSNPSRNAAVSLALRPAPITHDWLSEGPALKNISIAWENAIWLDAKDTRQEAETIAYRLFKANQDGMSAAVISPDRILTRRIATALKRWDLVPDDSAGVPLHLSPPGRLIVQSTCVFSNDFNTADLIALLKHPLVSSETDRGEHLRHTRDLELTIRSGRMHAIQKDILIDWGNEAPERSNWVSWLTSIFFKNKNENTSFEDWVTTHTGIIETLAAGPLGTASQVWDKDAGRNCLEALKELGTSSALAGKVTSFEYKSMLQRHLSSKEARNFDAPNCGIHIWGTLEARVQGVDLVILAGLNEGVWPGHQSHDPWLNRKMRKDAGLLLPDRRIGLSAHDFQQAIAGKNIWLTRSEKSDDADTIPSRWLNRLQNLLSGLSDDGKLALDTMKQKGRLWAKEAAKLDFVESGVNKEDRPAPAPPVAARPKQFSVTEVRTLIRDPFAFYAKNILRLRPLDNLGELPGPLLKGNIIHDALYAFMSNTDPNDFDAHVKLKQEIHDRIKALVPQKSIQKFWIEFANSMTDWFIEFETSKGSKTTHRELEIEGRLIVPKHDFTLIGIADRLDVLSTGQIDITDYKTGNAPSKNQQLKFDKQLPLLREMVLRGAFSLGSQQGAVLASYLQLRDPFLEIFSAEPTEDFWADFMTLLDTYFDPTYGFTARRAMVSLDQTSPYDHLSRYGEWGFSDSAVTKVIS